MGKAKTQAAWVLEQLKSGRKFTSLDAIHEFGITQLGTRIYELRNGLYDGTKYDIPLPAPMIKVKNRRGEDCQVAQYSLAPKTTLF